MNILRNLQEISARVPPFKASGAVESFRIEQDKSGWRRILEIKREDRKSLLVNPRVYEMLCYAAEL